MENRSDHTTRNRLDEIDKQSQSDLDELGAAYRRFEKTTTRILITIAVFTLFTGIVTVYLVAQNVHRAGEIQKQANIIQQQRYDNVFSLCESQNGRHDQTIARLESLVAHSPDRHRAESRRALRGTISLIDALVPHRDCSALAAQSVSSSKARRDDKQR